MAAAERRKLENKQQQQQQQQQQQPPQSVPGPPGSQPPSLHHHHSINNPISSHISQPPHSIAPHPGSRPSLDRAHTFPTPPTSASSAVGMGNPGGSYDSWAPNISGNVQNTQPLAIDTHAHSTPNTPATTPPGPPMQTIQSYQGQQAYDNSRPMYSSATTQQAQYASQPSVQPHNMNRLGTSISTNPYMKHDMGPPSSRPPGSTADLEHGSHKTDSYSHNPANDQGHGTGEEEADHEHDSEFAHDNSAAYGTSRTTYLGSLHGEHTHMSPEMNGSPSQQNGSGKGTPRTATGNPTQWATGYQTPPRAPPPTNHYNAISDTRGSVSNGTSGADSYGTGSVPSTYAPSHMNGSTASNKRMHEDDDADQQSRPASRGDDISIKRPKLGREGSVSGPMGGGAFERDARPINRTRNPITQRTRR